jgi:RNA polymerase sigma factor (sigma-70 family)
VTNTFTVYLVDDDVGVLNGLSRLLRVRNYDVKPYSSPQLFLEEHDVTVPGCAVLDVAMPGLDGLELQLALTASDGSHRPIVFITGKGDISTSVRAMKAGAIDFLTKPIKDEALFDAISQAEKRDTDLRKAQSELELIKAKMTALTPREREVLVHVVAGRPNKQIAAELGTVEKTIKVHRSRMMQKLGVRNVADLVRMNQRLDLGRGHPTFPIQATSRMSELSIKSGKPGSM